MFILLDIGVTGATGDGYLCDVHFHVIGSACNSSQLSFSDGILFNTSGDPGPDGQIAAEWIGSSVHVGGVCILGDVNEDGVVNMADVTKVERIILSLDQPTPCSDPNQDGVINMADVTKIERIILGLD
jgi:hypothetical protein